MIRQKIKIQIFQEALSFGKENDFGTTDICEIARRMCLLPKVNSNKSRVVVITQVSPTLHADWSKSCRKNLTATRRDDDIMTFLPVPRVTVIFSPAACQSLTTIFRILSYYHEFYQIRSHDKCLFQRPSISCLSFVSSCLLKQFQMLILF